jgi:hypothetical protein
MIKKFLPHTTIELIHWYERYISPVALIVGFLIDNFILLDRVDGIVGNVVLFTYLFLVGAGIILLNCIQGGAIKGALALRVAPFLPVTIQLFFGALFSGYLSLYARSAGVLVSWVFVIVLAALLLGNERFRQRYSALSFQVSVYFIALFSFFVFFIPLVIKKIGTPVFILSGLVSLAIISLMVIILRRAVPARMAQSRAGVTRNIAGIFIVFHVLYFSNLIPPLPLALKESGVYHSVERIGATYRMLEEQSSWRVRYLSMPSTLNLRTGEKAYVFTAIFAPTGLSTVVRHEWQLFNEQNQTWETKSDVRFTIFGGRDGGFRGYSEKYNPELGSWRVNILTESGLVIGRTRFTVQYVSDAPVLNEVEK